MKPVTIYVRVSPTGREECRSMDVQLERCRDWCRARSCSIVDWFGDEFKSGKNADNRLGLQNALKQIQHTRGILLVYKIDRLARKTLDILQMADRIEKLGADLASVMEDFNTTTVWGRGFFQFRAMYAELEGALISERTREAMQTQQANGIRMCHPDKVPYGYMLDVDGVKNKKSKLPAILVANPQEQKAIARMRFHRDRGKSFRKIALHLDAEGFTRRDGSPWSPKGISVIQTAIQRGYR